MENQAIIRNFGILYRTFLSYISKSITSRDIAFSDCIFLINIGESEGISQEEIAAHLAIDKAAIARSVKSMEQKGYIQAKKSVSDKRAKELSLSETGRELYQFMRNLQAEWLKQVLGNLDDEIIRNFAQTISGISERAKNVKRPTVD